MRKITLDIETTGNFGANNDVLSLDLAVVCIHDSKTDAFTCYTQEELPALWQILERADLIIGYNSDHFDIPILNKYYTGDLSHIKSVDLLKEIKEVLGRRLRLDNVAEATLGCKKSGSGLQSIEWWNNGE
ncbi:MAG TPA: ribonuclease H-like domain-containing protein, partial [Candidatus Paceibacterota bacterium]